ncbi:hypothetical protein ACTWPT_42825 [Nonomuraea sp. 3N208]|uniref:hypothetical protein n=1 Tax=Nonomuraea sp. 3N208 TaxID=3457421 RepID=UPI003FCFBC40
MSANRVAILCAHLDHDPGVRKALDEGGLPAARWDELIGAVRVGAALDALAPLLDAMDAAAAAAGLDGVTTGTRRFEPLPAAVAGVREVHAWRCPHARPCGRVEPGGDGRPPVCALTTDPLAAVKVISR